MPWNCHLLLAVGFCHILVASGQTSLTLSQWFLLNYNNAIHLWKKLSFGCKETFLVSENHSVSSQWLQMSPNGDLCSTVVSHGIWNQGHTLNSHLLETELLQTRKPQRFPNKLVSRLGYVSKAKTRHKLICIKDSWTQFRDCLWKPWPIRAVTMPFPTAWHIASCLVR